MLAERFFKIGILTDWITLSFFTVSATPAGLRSKAPLCAHISVLSCRYEITLLNIEKL